MCLLWTGGAYLSWISWWGSGSADGGEDQLIMLAVCRRSVPDEYLDQLVGEGLMQETDKTDTGNMEDLYFCNSVVIIS